MMSVKSILAFLMLLVCFVTAKKKDDEDASAQAIRDMQTGMAGLKETGNNPALLAQLMKDMQDPELMAEAKKMMDSPQFQNEMKKMSQTKEFKSSQKTTVDMMKDPSKSAEAEAKFEHMLEVGNNDLKKAAGGVMEDAMAAMANPEVMAEMSKMIKDPNFQQQLADMAKDPSFKSYVDAMKDMMDDPAKKKKMEQLGDAVRSGL